MDDPRFKLLCKKIDYIYLCDAIDRYNGSLKTLRQSRAWDIYKLHFDFKIDLEMKRMNLINAIEELERIVNNEDKPQTKYLERDFENMSQEKRDELDNFKLMKQKEEAYLKSQPFGLDFRFVSRK